jgi:hypothetical protein
MFCHCPHVLFVEYQGRLLSATEFQEGLLVLSRVVSDGHISGLFFTYEEYST